MTQLENTVTESFEREIENIARDLPKPFALYFAKDPQMLPGYSLKNLESGTTGSSGTQKDD